MKPAVIFKAVPGYCLPPYRGSKYTAYESVECSNVHCMGDRMADFCLWKAVVIDNFTLFWELVI